ncbi:TPA: VirB4 family type IV secretion/conjugal transfer ATPase [Serratia marcescens]
MATVFKALTRPPLLIGVPVAPALIVFFALFMAGLVFTKFLWVLIPLIFIFMRRKTAQDEHYFDLISLWLKTKGNPVINNFYGVSTISCQSYDAVDVTEFIDAMKLNQRAPLEKIIPYSSHIDKAIIKNRGSDLVATWEVDGEPFECQTQDVLDMLATQLNKAIVSYSGEAVTFYVHKVRRKFHDDLDSPSGNVFADKISSLYYAGIKTKPFYKVSIFVTLCFIPFNKEEKAERKTKGDRFKKKTQQDAILRMNELRSSVESMLQRYRPKALGLFEKNNRVYSSQISFYNYLITGAWQDVLVTNTPFYELLGSSDVFISSDSAQVNNFDSRRYFRSIEIKGFTKLTEPGLLDSLIYEPVEYVLTQSFTSMSKSEAKKAIHDQEKRLSSTQDDAVEEKEDLEIAKSMLTSGDISFGLYHYSLLVYADSLEQLIKDTNQIRSTLTDIGLIVTLSTLSLPAAFCAQLPGVYHLRPRLVPVSSQNFVELTSLHSVMSGKRDKTPWGEAIVIAKTNSQAPYYLNVHNTMMGQDDFNRKTTGNVKIIGTTGSGKTVLLTFLQNAFQKYANPESFSPQAKSKRMTTVYFDKDRGAELNVRALGGEYFRIKAGEPTGWNPFKLEPTKRNRAFVKNLMKLIVTRRGEVLTARQEIDLYQAVDDVMDLPRELRSYGITRVLETLNEPTTVQAQENGLRIRLSQWKKGADFGWVFDNDEDSFDISHIDNFGIDGTEFLDDEDTRSPIAFYLLYRVTSLLDGRRLVLILDEFWKWLANDAFADFVYNKLKTIRKLNGIVIFATQSLDEVLKHKISKATLEQTSTDIYLANPKADYAEYVEGAKVDPAHFEIIKNIDPESRQFLIVKTALRKGDVQKFAALVSFDLSCLGVYTKVLSGSEDNLEIFDSIFKPGMKPEQWLDAYLNLAL